MLKIRNIIASESNSVDKETGSLSLFNIFDVITAPAFPVLMNKLTVAVTLEREQSDKPDGNIELIVKQNGKTSFTQLLPFLFSENICITKLIVKINGFIINEPGIIEFVVKYENKLTTNSIAAMLIGTKL
jgi:hypothetical protein